MTISSQHIVKSLAQHTSSPSNVGYTVTEGNKYTRCQHVVWRLQNMCHQPVLSKCRAPSCHEIPEISQLSWNCPEISNVLKFHSFGHLLCCCDKTKMTQFLPCDAMCCTVLVSVILSVCLSHSCTVSTWFDLGSWFLHHMVAPSL